MKQKFNVCGSKRVLATPNPPDVPYQELVCSQLLIARYTRPDIVFADTLLCRFLLVTLKCIGSLQNGFYATQQAQQTEYCSTLETPFLEPTAISL